MYAPKGSTDNAVYGNHYMYGPPEVLADPLAGHTPRIMAGLGKVVVLLGGNGTEMDRKCSLESGGAILAELLALGVDAEALDPVTRPLTDLYAMNADRIFNALFSRDGEDGRLQAWLEQLGVPYTGSGVTASALCFDKIKCKQVMSACHVPTATFVPVYAGTWRSLDLDAVLQEVGGTAFVKPAREASTMGASRASTTPELEAAIALALERDSHVVVESFLPGKEFLVPVIDGEVLPPCEVRFSKGHTFYDAHLKYEVPASEKFVCPSSLPPEKERELKDIVLEGYRALGISEYTRADVRQDEQGDFYVMEYNTGATFTRSGSFAASAYAAGMTFGDLVTRLLRNASIGK